MLALVQIAGAVFNLTNPGRYIHWGFIQISLANLIVIALMVITFFLALLIPFHRKGGRS